MSGTGIIKFTYNLLQRILFHFTFAHPFMSSYVPLTRASGGRRCLRYHRMCSYTHNYMSELAVRPPIINNNSKVALWQDHEIVMRSPKITDGIKSVIGSPNQKEWRCVILQASRWQNMEKTALWSALMNPNHCVSLMNERYNYLEGEDVFNFFEWYLDVLTRVALRNIFWADRVEAYAHFCC